MKFFRFSIDFVDQIQIQVHFIFTEKYIEFTHVHRPYNKKKFGEYKTNSFMNKANS